MGSHHLRFLDCDGDIVRDASLTVNVNCPGCRSVISVSSSSSDLIVCPDCGLEFTPLELLTVSADKDFEGASTREEDLEFNNESTVSPGMAIGHFRLIRRLGEGGFGTVFDAFDTRLERHVAIKIPNTAMFTPKQAETFIREARAAAQIQDPNIVSVFEVGREGNYLYIASELINGKTLTRWCNDQPQDLQTASTIVSKLATSMHKAHEVDIVHRDLKPGNIIVDQNGEPHITDFGLAKRIDNLETYSRDGAILGTPAFMSPEQASGQANQADRRSDVYSLGVIYYQMLSNARPFRGDDQKDLLSNVRKGRSIPIREHLPSIHPDAEAICQKAMALAPSDRYSTALEMADDLNRLLEGKPVLARDVNLVQRTGYFVRRNFLLCSLAAGTSVLTGAASYWLRGNDSDASDAERLTEFTVRVSPQDAVVTITPISDETGARLDTSSIELVANKAGIYSGKLRPGLYVVRAETQSSILEAYRVIPKDENEFREIGFRMTNWEFNESSGLIELHPIKAALPSIDPNGIGIHDIPFSAIVGGRFEGGTNSIRTNATRVPKPLFPVGQKTVEDFYVSVNEITVNQFNQVMGDRFKQLTNGQPIQNPVTNISWIHAVEFAERVGARLPTFLEYQYVATNGGTTKFPWGDDDRDAFGESALEHQSDYDSNHPIPVKQLYSGNGEWLWNSEFVGTFKQDSVVPIPANANIGRSARLVVGLPQNGLSPTPQQQAGDGPGVVLSLNRSTTHERISFRIVYPIKKN